MGRARGALRMSRPPTRSIRDSVGLEDPTHEDRRATSPYARFDEVPRNAILQDSLDAAANVLHPFQTDHRFGAGWPITADFSDLRIVRSLAHELESGFRERRPNQSSGAPAQARLVAMGETEDVVTVFRERPGQASASEGPDTAIPRQEKSSMPAYAGTVALGLSAFTSPHSGPDRGRGCEQSA